MKLEIIPGKRNSLLKGPKELRNRNEHEEESGADKEACGAFRAVSLMLSTWPLAFEYQEATKFSKRGKVIFTFVF